MFHRVKSEAQKTQTVQNTESTPEQEAAREQQAQVRNNPEQKPEKEVQPKQQQQETQQTQQKEEDMSEKGSEQGDTEKQPQGNGQAQNIPPVAQAQQATTSPYTAGSSTAFPGYAAKNVQSAQNAVKSGSDGERRLVIGKGISMSGEIEACDYLLVEGTIEAALKGARKLEISDTGTFYGTVEISEATIAGRFEGDLTVDGRLSIKAGGVITGSISYKELEIEAGAMIDGKLTPLRTQESGQTKKKPEKSRTVQQKQPVRGETPEPANADGQLFAEAAGGAE